MNEIALHIDFLLHTHDCIIIPNLGGFVLNTIEVEKNGLWGLNAPKLELMFNNKLSYNDGLLAESLMKINGISFQDAMKKIEAACEELRSKLLNKEEVTWHNLGVFKTDHQNNFIFLPTNDYVRPQFFGLTNSRFKTAVLRIPVTSNEEESIPVKSIVKYVSTAIVAAIALLFVVISYNNSNSSSQYAEIVSKPLIFKNTGSITNLTSSKLLSSNEIDEEISSSKDAIVNTKPELSSKRYYVIVGVYEVRESAEKSLNKLKKQGFESASMIERPRRLDVYSASFSNKDEALSYLQKLRIDRPEYHDAWILNR